VIELDGADHFTAGGQAYDEFRDKQLRALGLEVLRFENFLIFENIESVLKEIVQQFKQKC
jgi:very-short-patch-repair endonuclease